MHEVVLWLGVLFTVSPTGCKRLLTVLNDMPCQVQLITADSVCSLGSPATPRCLVSVSLVTPPQLLHLRLIGQDGALCMRKQVTRAAHGQGERYQLQCILPLAVHSLHSHHP